MFVLGNVATSGVSGSTITFTTSVGDVAFPIGGTLYKVSGSTFVTLSLTVTAISGDKQITASSSVTGVNDGDTIVVLANAGIEGDQLRDYYARINLTNSSTSEIELYAVNAVYAKSNLHNELGQ
jgi:endonuclease YncB( thermonuclease family)